MKLDIGDQVKLNEATCPLSTAYLIGYEAVLTVQSVGLNPINGEIQAVVRHNTTNSEYAILLDQLESLNNLEADIQSVQYAMTLAYYVKKLKGEA